MADEDHEDVADSWEDLDSRTLDRKGRLDTSLYNVSCTGVNPIVMYDIQGSLLGVGPKGRNVQELDKRLEGIVTKKKEPKNKSTNMSRVTYLQEDSQRTPFQPQVKILKRQPGVQSAGAASQKSSPSRAVRSLEEREAAYAEARMRILGSAGSSENTPAADRSPRVIQQIEEMKLSTNVMRQPSGPDGTKGFRSTTTTTR